MNNHPVDKCQFASDNYAGICPEAWKALEESNNGFVHSYGEDVWTENASNKIREIFDANCDVYFVFNGTAANSLALASLCQSYHSIICYEQSHIETDECGAPEFFSNGTKILLCGGENGKISVLSAERIITRRSDIHFPRPKVISITQATESGTVYTVSELKAIQEINDPAASCEVLRWYDKGIEASFEELYPLRLKNKYGLKIHMDGARFANAAASLEIHPSEITWKTGVDVLCFGGTKNGLAIGETVIFFNRDLSKEFDYRCKQGGQLASKMRFLSAPWAKILESGAWLKNAKKANSSARLLKDKLAVIKNIEVMYPVEANTVFIKMPEEIKEGLKRRGWHFYNFIATGYNRFMCSWKTSEQDILDLVNDFQELTENL